MVWTEKGKIGSGDMYADIHSTLATTPDLPWWRTDPGVKSVLLPKGLDYWMETYRDKDFGGYMMRAESSNEDWTTCVNFEQYEGG